MQKKILIIDNEKNIINVIKLSLEIDNYESFSALDADSAFEILSKEKIDLILLDIMMTGINGLEFLKRLKTNEEYKTIPVIMLTAIPAEESLPLAFKLGAVDYVCKPFTIDVLLARIKKHLSVSQQTQDVLKYKNNLQLILDNANIGVILLSLEKYILFANKYAKQNYLAIDFGDCAKSLFYGNYNCKLCKIDEVIKENKKISYEFEFKNKDANIDYLYIEGYPAKNNDGENIGVVLIISNITEQKKLQNHILHQEKLASVGQLSASFAHEINNPMTYVKGCLQMLIEDDKTPALIKNDAEQMLSETKRVLFLLEKMLVLSRKNELNEPLINLNLIETIDESLLLLKHKLKKKNVKIIKNYELKDVYVKGIKWAILQVIINIIINAADAIGKFGEINLDLEESKTEVVLKIIDNGTGISKKNLGKIFEPFFTTKQMAEGTGLGLYITKKIMNYINGNIEINNLENKEGVVVKLTFEK